MNDCRGATWRVWDLHVHTPDSIVQNYGPRNKETWEKFITDLENLPDRFKVLGINDYMFLDGYKKICAAKKAGRLANIDLLLPVIELRLDKFGGTDSSLSRVNFHVIFSDEIPAETIEQQFLNALSRHYKLSPEFAGIEWSGVPSRGGLEDLGTRLIQSVPTEERNRFSSPMVEGFNNLTLSLEAIHSALESSYFKGKHVTAVGKTEWWNIKWNDRSIADKKTIINEADLVFIASGSVSDFNKAKDGLKRAGVNDRLLDCSDAHSFQNSKEKDRLGNCLCWIKGDPTFLGLRHLLVEPEERLFMGEEPPENEVVRRNKTRFLSRFEIHRDKSARGQLNEQWFDVDLKLGHGLVAVIGNKGSGKSALADAIGLLGESRNQDSFSFLCPDKFRKMPENKARFFRGEMTWESGEKASAGLEEDVDTRKVERVKYIPQGYFEKICTELPGPEKGAFDREMEAVIFSHIGEAERLNAGNLQELIDFKTGEIKDRISQAKLRLSRTNGEIVQLEGMLEPGFRRGLEESLETRNAALRSHLKEKPRVVRKPKGESATSVAALERLEGRIEALATSAQEKRERRREVVRLLAKLDKVKSKLTALEEQARSIAEEVKEDLEELGINSIEIVKLEITWALIERAEAELAREKIKLDREMDETNEGSVPRRLSKAKEDGETLRERMGAPTEKYRKYVEELRRWDETRHEIIGDEKSLGTIEYFKHQLDGLEEVPTHLSELREKRERQARDIYQCLAKEKVILRDLYTAVQRFISENPDIGKKIELNFAVAITDVGFEDAFLEFINMNRSGPFMGANEGRRAVRDLLRNYRFDDEEDALEFAKWVESVLRGKTQAGVEQAQLKKGKTIDGLYDFLYGFGYLEPRYMLRLGEKELRQLSPGERGALLIVFYLLVDRETTPLVIDQPEHNLDNETVTRLLVPAIKKAKTRRQLIVVTHNPILAVVCNADQIIVASLDIKAGNKVEYQSGAIENRMINRRVVDILEGTLPSFDNRDRKYIREQVAEYIDAVLSGGQGVPVRLPDSAKRRRRIASGT